MGECSQANTGTQVFSPLYVCIYLWWVGSHSARVHTADSWRWGPLGLEGLLVGGVAFDYWKGLELQSPWRFTRKIPEARSLNQLRLGSGGVSETSTRGRYASVPLPLLNHFWTQRLWAQASETNCRSWPLSLGGVCWSQT